MSRSASLPFSTRNETISKETITYGETAGGSTVKEWATAFLNAND